jgi:glycosyltransferase involved in cell wall biosynthesis
MIVIPNGFDLTHFKPDPFSRESVRQELGIAKDALLIGLVGRFDPKKDHDTFLRAAAFLHSCKTEVHFLLCGDQITWENAALKNEIETLGIVSWMHLLGKREDIPRLTSALDIAVSSSSFGEGFPNTIGEAMACGVPCVVTDVGDSALIVGDTGRVVPPKDPHALVIAWNHWIEMGLEHRKQWGLTARRRVEEQYSLPAIVEKYEHLYQEMASHVRS